MLHLGRSDAGQWVVTDPHRDAVFIDDDLVAIAERAMQLSAGGDAGPRELSAFPPQRTRSYLPAAVAAVLVLLGTAVFAFGLSALRAEHERLRQDNDALRTALESARAAAATRATSPRKSEAPRVRRDRAVTLPAPSKAVDPATKDAATRKPSPAAASKPAP